MDEALALLERDCPVFFMKHAQTQMSEKFGNNQESSRSSVRILYDPPAGFLWERKYEHDLRQERWELSPG